MSSIEIKSMNLKMTRIDEGFTYEVDLSVLLSDSGYRKKIVSKENFVASEGPDHLHLRLDVVAGGESAELIHQQQIALGQAISGEVTLSIYHEEVQLSGGRNPVIYLSDGTPTTKRPGGKLPLREPV